MSASTRSSAHCAIPRRALLRELVVHVRQHRIVHLEDEAGVDDLEILLAQRVGDREHVVALVLVVLVGRIVAGAGRRHRRQEAFGDAGRRQRRLEVGDVAADGLVTLIPDRSDAGVAGRADRRRGGTRAFMNSAKRNRSRPSQTAS